MNVIIKKILCSAALSIIFQCAFAQAPECYKFKDGKFKVADPQVGGIWIIERKGSSHTESNEALKTILKFKVTWLDDCTYILKLDAVVRNDNKLPMPKEITVAVKIISTSKNSSVQEVTSSLYNQPYRCDVIKIQ